MGYACWVSLFGFALVTWAANGDAPKPAPVDPYLAILDEARAAPVEVFADITFRVLTKLAPTPKAAALEEVFRRAGEAREALPLRCVLRQPPEPIEAVQRASNLRLDALSLHCRAVQELLKTDPKLARELFDQMVRPEVPRADCGQAFVGDAGPYIQTLAAVAGQGRFTAEERTKQVPWFMVERGARGVSSSWEIVAAATELPRFARTEKEASALAAALASSLSLSDSDRAFTTAMRDGRLVSAVLAAESKLKTARGADTAILPALRDYLVRHLAGVRCEDFITIPPGGWASRHVNTIAPALRFVEGFEAFNTAVSGRADIAPISFEESKPTKLEGRAAQRTYADDPTFQALSSEVAALARIDPGESLWTVRLTAEWGFQARGVLARIEDWHGVHGQDALEVFHRKCRLLSRITDVAPAGETWRIALNELIALMEDPAILNRSPAEWLLEVEWLLGMQQIFTTERVETLRRSLGGEAADSFAYQTGGEIAKALAASRLPALSLYGRLALLRSTP